MDLIGYVFDLSSLESFNSIDNWVQEVKIAGGERVLPILIGNKSDISSNLINTSMIESLQSKYKLNYFQISAKNKEQVDNTFNEIISFAYETLFRKKK